MQHAMTSFRASSRSSFVCPASCSSYECQIQVSQIIRIVTILFHDRNTKKRNKAVAIVLTGASQYRIAETTRAREISLTQNCLGRRENHK